MNEPLYRGGVRRRSLEPALGSVDDPDDYARRSAGRHPYPVPTEFTNWIEAERRWRETYCLSDPSTMKDRSVEGAAAGRPTRADHEGTRP